MKDLNKQAEGQAQGAIVTSRGNMMRDHQETEKESRKKRNKKQDPG